MPRRPGSRFSQTRCRCRRISRTRAFVSSRASSVSAFALLSTLWAWLLECHKPHARCVRMLLTQDCLDADAERDALAKLEKEYARKEGNANEVRSSNSKPAAATPTWPQSQPVTDLELEISRQRESCEGMSSVQAQWTRSALPPFVWLAAMRSSLVGYGSWYRPGHACVVCILHTCARTRHSEDR